ncbi:maleylpyruvate isomerase family mycothiol-dependent enzyme [Iamia sp.]|uniref:maleylpyruvate isomerase family mycothiol-dependent enzyme n=1 Tax=Iamia sp. TaxID=2722710 RepID=UPI002C8E7D4C|nr:maleylpyruvate isomerase family mycothiol-dependent enzyme [Iamia sp.]HXH59226.1 maleylpyruvate isomerase family mycothiol-dependent enzyme [Iamia sp.]
MKPDEHRATIAAEGGAVAALPASGLGTAVPSCPGWSVERLVGHLGRVHVWAAAFLAAGPDGGEVDAGPRPPKGEAVLAWYREALDGLLAQLDRQDPAAPTTSFAGPSTAAFWFRRQAHEIAMHRWDAQDAITPGGAIPFRTPAAVDGIDEWLDVFVPRVLDAAGGPPSELIGATLHLHCTDDGLAAGTGEWLIRLTEAGAEITRAHAKGDAAVRGEASDILLAVWHRVPLDGLDVVGDVTRAQAILDLVHVT